MNKETLEALKAADLGSTHKAKNVDAIFELLKHKEDLVDYLLKVEESKKMSDDTRLGANRFSEGKPPASYLFTAGRGYLLGSVYTQKEGVLIQELKRALTPIEGTITLSRGEKDEVLIILKDIYNFILENNDVAEVLNDLCYVGKVGADNHGEFNYRKGFVWSTIIDSYMRHSLAAEEGQEVRDKETGLLHDAHKLANVLILVEHVEDNLGVNDFVGRDKPLKDREV